jgi:hypothetical protein
MPLQDVCAHGETLDQGNIRRRELNYEDKQLIEIHYKDKDKDKVVLVLI